MNSPVNSFSQSDGKHAATAPVEASVKNFSKPRTQSGRRKGIETLKRFFADNPGEELTVNDAASKLGITEKSAGTYLATLKGNGVLERVSIYRLKETT